MGNTYYKSGNEKVIGKLRKAQLITTFGSGSIVDLPECSIIIAGTDYWYENNPKVQKKPAKEISEPNLERMLRVSKLIEPQVMEEDRDYPTPDIPAFRFPYYHFCPKCKRLRRYWEFDDPKGLYCSSDAQGHKHDKTAIIPSRFVVACVNGHLEDFPYEWWVHKGKKCAAITTTDGSNGKTHRKGLAVKFMDETGGLDSMIIQCLDCGMERSMAGSVTSGALEGVRCQRKRPWLGRYKPDPKLCGAALKVLPRGASNVYYPVTANALTIPRINNDIQDIIEKKWNDGLKDLMDQPQPGVDLRKLVAFAFNDVLKAGFCSLDQLIFEIGQYQKGITSHKIKYEYDRQKQLEDEYRVFQIGDYEGTRDSQFKIQRTEVPIFLSDYIEDIVLAKRLREVMALRGFRRIFSDAPDKSKKRFEGYHFDTDYISLSDDDLDWLPAIEMLGEGIFIRIKESALLSWEDQSHCMGTYDQMYNRLKEGNIGCENFSPRYVMLHTLSHLLIRQLALECGYSSAAIKERIYSTYESDDDSSTTGSDTTSLPMAGILIYTASSDSDGSLGGLVRQGLPESFEKIFRNMLQEASWCASDPVCIDSTAQGYSSLNYAACHACTLLSETSCEMRNCLLDRASVVGKIQDRSLGFFGSLINANNI